MTLLDGCFVSSSVIVLLGSRLRRSSFVVLDSVELEFDKKEKKKKKKIVYCAS